MMRRMSASGVSHARSATSVDPRVSARLPNALRILAAAAGLLLALVSCGKQTQPASNSNGGVGSAGTNKIVVLGSSTSAGTGPKDPNNAYVPRYQAYLAQQFPKFTLLNLAVGGQTTYHIQPTGFSSPESRPTPTPDKNITAALALDPDAIIVNMPSNDTAANIPASEQLD